MSRIVNDTRDFELLYAHMIPDIIPEAQYMGLLAEQKIRDGYAGADIAYYEPFYLKQFIAAQSHVKGLK